MGECCTRCGYDVAGPVGVDENGMRLVCADSFHLLDLTKTLPARTYWAFGDIVRVDPVKNPKVPQPDDRRWMILQAANTSASRQWVTLFIGPSAYEPTISNWSSMWGFERVEE